MSKTKSELELAIPPAVFAGLQRYIKNGILPGGFLTAVLQNDLIASFERADQHSKAAMEDIVTYMYNYIPMAAWGSPERVRDWSELKRREATA